MSDGLTDFTLPTKEDVKALLDYIGECKRIVSDAFPDMVYSGRPLPEIVQELVSMAKRWEDS